MVNCDYCGSEILSAFPFECKYCGGTFCVDHHLPENHNCQGIAKKNIFENLNLALSGRSNSHTTSEKSYKNHNKTMKKNRKKKTQVQNSSHKKHNKSSNSNDEKKSTSISDSKPVKSNNVSENDSFFNSLKERFVFWFNERSRRHFYPPINLLFPFLYILILFFLIRIEYINLSKLNEIIILFLPLGSVLLILTVLFFIFEIYSFIKKLRLWFKGERNGVQLLVFLLALFFLILVYYNQVPIIDFFVSSYESIDFDQIFSPFSYNSSNSSNSSVSSIVSPIISSIENLSDSSDPPSDPGTKPVISTTSLDIEKNLYDRIFSERAKKGLPSFIFDEELSDAARLYSYRMVSENFFSVEYLPDEYASSFISSMPLGSVEGIPFFVKNTPLSVSRAIFYSLNEDEIFKETIYSREHLYVGIGCVFNPDYFKYVCTLIFV